MTFPITSLDTKILKASVASSNENLHMVHASDSRPVSADSFYALGLAIDVANAVKPQVITDLIPKILSRQDTTSQIIIIELTPYEQSLCALHGSYICFWSRGRLSGH